jgi:diguanylate cyclase (GGDEF)-like protein
LCTVATRLVDAVRGEDIGRRFGGEEFAIISPDISLEAVARRAEEIRVRVAGTELEFNGQLMHISISLGIASFPEHGPQAMHFSLSPMQRYSDGARVADDFPRMI